uniref:Uncharacterized protein n=1 Tax=Zea mays TaxID=4577 RepID=C0HHM2_MAIZE|nr:unknown [Zea mays]|eukprot:NP_001167918.1 uncharacterized protein LOC100381630 [Zea mays]
MPSFSIGSTASSTPPREAATCVSTTRSSSAMPSRATRSAGSTSSAACASTASTPTPSLHVSSSTPWSMRRCTILPSPSPTTLPPAPSLQAYASRASVVAPASTMPLLSSTPCRLLMHPVARRLAASSPSSAAVDVLRRQASSLVSFHPVMCMVRGSMDSLVLASLMLR